MALTTGSKELREAIENLETVLEDGTQADDVTLEIVEGVMNVKAGALSADAAGRALMATDYFNAATILLKIADGAFAADAATRALFANGIWTGAKLATGALQQLVCTAGNGAGARTLTGAAVGDRVVGVFNHTDGAMNTAAFESTITVINQIQQTATDLTSKACLVTLIKA
jgi:hypothetical protein